MGPFKGSEQPAHRPLIFTNTHECSLVHDVQLLIETPVGQPTVILFGHQRQIPQQVHKRAMGQIPRPAEAVPPVRIQLLLALRWGVGESSQDERQAMRQCQPNQLTAIINAHCQSDSAPGGHSSCTEC